MTIPRAPRFESDYKDPFQSSSSLRPSQTVSLQRPIRDYLPPPGQLYIKGSCSHLNAILKILRQIPPQQNPQVLNLKHQVIVRTDSCSEVYLCCLVCFKGLKLFTDEYSGIFKESKLLIEAQMEALRDIESINN